MSNLINGKIPNQAIQTLKIVKDLFGSSIVGVYLFGSAVNGGLRINSDVDVLVVVNHSLPQLTRKKLTERLMTISGKIGNTDSVRPLEVTVINRSEVVPWQYPPKREFIYGEWLRGEFENGQIQEPSYDPDLAIVLAQARKIKGDERNVILTLARMWQTVTTGEITSKDVAAEWAIPLLPKEHVTLLDIARKGYRGECDDKWEGLYSKVKALVKYMKNSIETSLN